MKIKYTIQIISIIAMLFSALPANATQEEPKWLGKLQISDYKDKVIYLDFWASWCGPCRKSFPWLNSMQEKYRDKGLVVIGINLDADIDTAKQFLKHVPANFLLFSDAHSLLAKQYELVGMPSSYIINNNGDLLDRHIGFKSSNADVYEEKIVSLLSQLPINNQ